MTKIVVPHGVRGKLASDFKVSIVTVRSALNGITKSQLANSIRKAAIERGGMACVAFNDHSAK